MSAHPPDSDAWASRTTRNTLGLAAWTAAWVASVALAAFGPEFLWNNEPAPTLIAIAFTVLVGIGLLFANKRNLQALDELQRTIQLQAMAWSSGPDWSAAWPGRCSPGTTSSASRPRSAHLIAFMALVYLAGFVAGLLRYR